MAKKPSPGSGAQSRPAVAEPTVVVQVERLSHGEDLPLPAYQTDLAAGLDLVAAIPWDAPLALLPGSRTLVPTGLKIAVPAGYEAQVRPRSGLALKSGVTVLNSPGTIDADYRGEVGVILANLGGSPFEIRRGERIAQLVIAPVVQAQLTVVEALDETARGEGGFGSTGKATAVDDKTTKSAKATTKKTASQNPTAQKPATKKAPAKSAASKPTANTATKKPAKKARK